MAQKIKMHKSAFEFYALFPGENGDQHTSAANGTAKAIDGIGDKKNVIFVIHMHMHLTAFHYSIFHDRMRHISDSVRNLMQKIKV